MSNEVFFLGAVVSRRGEKNQDRLPAVRRIVRKNTGFRKTLPLGKRLFEKANRPKRFVTIAGGDHNDPPSEEFLQAIDEFLDQLPPTNGVPDRL